MFLILKREKEFLIYFGLKYAFASIFAKNHTKSVNHNLEPNYSEKEEEDEDVLVYQVSILVHNDSHPSTANQPWEVVKICELDQ